MKRIVVGVAIIAVAAAMFFASSSDLSVEPDSTSASLPTHRDGLARQLLSNRKHSWQTYQLERGHLHFAPESYAAVNAAALADTINLARTRVLGFLALRDTAAIEVFLVDSRERMRELIGRPIAGMVESGERTALLVASARYHPFVMHELTHLYSHYHWGPPVNGRWISEGLAMLAAGDCQGHSIDELSKGLLEDGKVLPWTEFVRAFDTLDEVTANLQAASIVYFIKSQLGPAAVRELWQARSWQALERMWQRPIDQTEASWRRRLSALPKGARLDVERLQETGC